MQNINLRLQLLMLEEDYKHWITGKERLSEKEAFWRKERFLLLDENKERNDRNKERKREMKKWQMYDSKKTNSKQRRKTENTKKKNEERK